MDEGQRVIVEEGVTVGTAGPPGPGTRPLLADLFRPPPARGEPPGRGWPAVLLVHGGAWREGDRSQLRGYGILLARAGYLALACEYRLSPRARWPEHLHDVKTALRWLRAGAGPLRVDPDRIAVSGNSAGGHLALMVAGTPGVAELEGDGGNPGVATDVAACIAIYAPTVLLGDHPAVPGRPVDMITDRPSDEVARQASPVTWARAGFPPTLLIHGSHDQVVPMAASQVMHDALRGAEVPVELHLYADQPHAFDADRRFGRRTGDEMVFFLDRYLGADRTDPAAAART